MVSILLLAQPVDARKLYVNESGTQAVAVIESTTGAMTNVPLTASFPLGIALTPDGGRAYVATVGGGMQTTFDTFMTANPVAAAVSLTGQNGPSAVAVAPDGAFALIGDTGNPPGLAQIATASDAQTNQVGLPLSDAIADVAISPGGGVAYVPQRRAPNPDRIDVLDLGSFVLSPSPIALPAGASPQAAAISPDGRRLYVANYGTDSVSVIDTTTSQPVPGTPIALAATSNPRDVTISPDGRFAYVTRETNDGVAVIDTSSNSVIANVTGMGGGASFRHAAPSPDGTRLYVANDFAGGTVDTVSTIDTATNAVVGSPVSLGAGTNPRSLVATPDQGPVASFGVSAADAGSATTFDASASYDPDGSIARYDWDFGDGTALPDGGRTPTHTYASADTYTAALTVTDNDGTSTGRVFTGHTMLRNGSGAARISATVFIPADAEPSGATDTTEPTVKVAVPRSDKRYRWRRLRHIRGTASDESGIRDVQYALAYLPAKQRGRRAKRASGKRCRYLRTSGKLARKQTPCNRQRFLGAKGTSSWSVRIKRRLPKGHYRLYVRATDGQGNTSKAVLVPFELA